MAKAATLDVVAVVPIHDHSDPAFPKVTPPGERCTLERDLAERLIAKGDAVAVKDVPKDADPAEVAALAATAGRSGAP